MSADLISMDSALEGADSAPDTGTDSAGGDYGLSGLEQALDSTSTGEQGGGQPSAPPPPSSAPSGYQRADFTGRRGSYQQAQGSWKSRQMQRQQQLESARLEREGFKEQMSQIADLMKQTVALTQKPGEQEPPPDPFTDWAGFQAWQAKQQDALLDAKLKPVIEYYKQTRERDEQVAQQQYHSQQQQEQITHTTSALQEAHASYARDYPELAHGAEERITFGLEALTNVLSNGLGWTEQGAQLAGTITLSIAKYAAAGGENPAAAVDAFYTNLTQEIGESIRSHYAALGYDLPEIMPAAPGGYQEQGGGYQQPMYQQPQVDPAARENARLQAVRQRSQGVASPRPRQPARGNYAQPGSRAHALANDYRRAGRDVDWNQVTRVAKEEAGGNFALAQKIIQAIPREA